MNVERGRAGIHGLSMVICQRPKEFDCCNAVIAKGSSVNGYVRCGSVLEPDEITDSRQCCFETQGLTNGGGKIATKTR